MMSLHFSVFRGSQIKGADSAAVTRIFGRFLGVETLPEALRNGATGRATGPIGPLPLFRLGGSVAQPASDLFAKLSISPHRTRKNEMQQNTSEMH